MADIVVMVKLKIFSVDAKNADEALAFVEDSFAKGGISYTRQGNEQVFQSAGILQDESTFDQ